MRAITVAPQLAYTQENGIDAYIADRNHRQRDPAFADYDRYKIRFRKDKRRYYGIDSLDSRPRTLSMMKRIEAVDVQREIGFIETATISTSMDLSA